MHYSGFGGGCSTVNEKELNDRTVLHRRQERSESFWFTCTIAESPNFSILKVEIFPVVAREGPGKAGGKNSNRPIGVDADADSVSGLGSNKKGHAPMWKVVITEIQDASALEPFDVPAGAFSVSKERFARTLE